MVCGSNLIGIRVVVDFLNLGISGHCMVCCSIRIRQRNCVDKSEGGLENVDEAQTDSAVWFLAAYVSGIRLCINSSCYLFPSTPMIYRFDSISLDQLVMTTQCE